jgi:glucokinase
VTIPTDTASRFIGVDLSGSALRSALVSERGEVISRRENALQQDVLAKQIIEAVTEFRAQSPEVAALGIGVPGLVNPETKRVIITSDLSVLIDSDLTEELVRATNLTVTVENDANAAAYGEYTAGAGRGSRDMFYVTLGKGIGGAIILNGKLWLGASGYAGEFGHITIDPEGEECYCGNTGCLETVASAPNIVRRTRERLYRDGTSSLSRLALNPDFKAADVAREAANGDDFALLMIERTGRYIGAGVASVINLFNIERIVLGGGIVSEAGDLIISPIKREAARRSFQPCFEATSIVAAALGADAVSIGAAMLARDAKQQKNN